MPCTHPPAPRALSLFSLLVRPRRPPPRARGRTAAAPPGAAKGRAAAALTPAGDPSTPVDAADRPGADGHPVCGWFDSSHELSCGLQVTEHAQPEALAQLVPLRWWLAWELEAVVSAPPPVR